MAPRYDTSLEDYYSLLILQMVHIALDQVGPICGKSDRMKTHLGSRCTAISQGQRAAFILEYGIKRNDLSNPV
jgi:hypothetical protein